MGNPSSLHSLGSQANRLLEQSRKQISELLSVQSQEIYFTSGGTEGNNWVLKGTAIEKQVFGKHIIISAIEHPAIAETAHQLKQLGFEISYAPVDKNGRVIVEQLAELIRKDTILVSIMAVNNEVGSIQPIQEISELLNDFPTVHFHVDAVQAIGKLPKELWLTPRVDFATISAHKFHGPRGIGFIYWKNGRKLAPLLNGGGQEKNQRSGTENLPAIVAMAKALRLYMAKIERQPNHMTTLKNYFVDALEEYNKVTIFSKKGNLFIPNILCFALKGVRGEAFVHALEEKQIYVSTTSACSSKKKIISSTLSAMKFPNDLATSAIRVSLDEDNTMAEIEQFMIIFHQLYKKFSKINS